MKHWVGWQKEKLQSSEQELEPILNDPRSLTAQFRRSLQNLFAELAAHGIYAVDHQRDHLVMREIWPEIVPDLEFYLVNGVNLDADVPLLVVDTVTQCDDENDWSAFTSVTWQDDCELRRRLGLPEVIMQSDIVSDYMFFSAKSEECQREAMFLCKALAPRFGLRVEFDGAVDVAATIWLDKPDDATRQD